MITRSQLVAVMPGVRGAPAQLAEDLNAAMDRFGVDRPARVAAFLAQLAHESGELRHWSENLNYGWQALRRVFPTYFRTDAEARARERQPERIANRVYGGRMGNGPEASGDGWRYRGRGPIQLTGKANYQACGEALGMDLVGEPERLETSAVGCLAAAWFWASRGLNALADAGDFEAITRRINGGVAGLPERRAFWERAKAVLGVAPVAAPAASAGRRRRTAAMSAARPAAKKAAARPRRKAEPPVTGAKRQPGRAARHRSEAAPAARRASEDKAARRRGREAPAATRTRAGTQGAAARGAKRRAVKAKRSGRRTAKSGTAATARRTARS